MTAPLELADIAPDWTHRVTVALKRADPPV